MKEVWEFEIKEVAVTVRLQKFIRRRNSAGPDLGSDMLYLPAYDT